MKLSKLTMQIKPAGSNCNISCKYCYAKPFRKSNITFLNQELLEKIVSEALNLSDNIIITWHGGEPMLPGINFYNNYIQILKKYKKSNQNVVNMIQTNAILVNDEFADFFYENNFIVSVSIDGNIDTHNKNRIYSNNK